MFIYLMKNEINFIYDLKTGSGFNDIENIFVKIIKKLHHLHDGAFLLYGR